MPVLGLNGDCPTDECRATYLADWSVSVGVRRLGGDRDSKTGRAAVRAMARAVPGESGPLQPRVLEALSESA